MLDLVASAVLDQYPPSCRAGRIEPLGAHGGFSGARLWRIHSDHGPLCLRAASAGEPIDHLRHRHGWMSQARSAGMRCVPPVQHTSAGESVVVAAGRCWELMDWMPGQADFRQRPSLPRLEAAATVLAQVHRAWEGTTRRTGQPCPAVIRRRAACQRPIPAPLPARHPAAPFLQRIRAAITPWLGRVEELFRGVAVDVPVQPCLRDVWHAHLLYDGDVVTGLVDYANVGIDSVTTDLARLFGSLIDDDEAGWRIALAAYRHVRPLSPAEEVLMRQLDRAGVIAGLANWSRWLSEADRTAEEVERARGRIEELLCRVERWQR